MLSMCALERRECLVAEEPGGGGSGGGAASVQCFFISPIGLKQSSKGRILFPENIQIAHFILYSIFYRKIKLIFHDLLEVSDCKYLLFDHPYHIL